MPVIVKVSSLLPEIPRLDRVVLDELSFLPFSKDGGQVLFQLCSDLHERVSIIITTNGRFADWNAIFADEGMTTSLLDRLTSMALRPNGSYFMVGSSVETIFQILLLAHG